MELSFLKRALLAVAISLSASMLLQSTMAVAQVIRSHAISVGHPDAYGMQPNGGLSLSPCNPPSADGRFAMFISAANNLVANDKNHRADVFLRDMDAGTTRCVTCGVGGINHDTIGVSLSMSDDQRFVSFVGVDGVSPPGPHGAPDFLLLDRQSGSVQHIALPVAVDGSRQYAGSTCLSSNGQFLALSVTTTTENGILDGSYAFLYRVSSDTLALLNLPASADGSGILGVSDDGQRVLVRKDAQLHLASPDGTDSISVNSLLTAAIGTPVAATTAQISADGKVLAAWARMESGYRLERLSLVDASHIEIVTDPQARHVEVLGMSTDGARITFAIHKSADDGYRLFEYQSSDGLVHDLLPGTTIGQPIATSRDGHFLASRGEGNLPAWKYNALIERIDLQSGQVEPVSVADAGGPFPGFSNADPDTRSAGRTVSADGRYVAFESYADNLVANDTTGRSDTDVFVHDRATGTTERVNVRDDGGEATDSGAYLPAISANGRRVAFVSSSRMLVGDDVAPAQNVFLRDLDSAETLLVSRDESGQPLNTDSARPSISDDGRFVAYLNTSPLPGDQQIVGARLFDAESGQSRAIAFSPVDAEATNANRVDLVQVSSNGQRIGLATGAGEVHLVDLDHGTSRLLGYTRPGATFLASSEVCCRGALSLTPDGRYLSFVGWTAPAATDPEILIADLDNDVIRHVHPVFSGEEAGFDTNLVAPSLSDDGRFIAFAAGPAPFESEYFGNYGTNIYRHDLQTGNTLPIAHDAAGRTPLAAGFASLSADGRWLFATTYGGDWWPDTGVIQPGSESALLFEVTDAFFASGFETR